MKNSLQIIIEIMILFSIFMFISTIGFAFNIGTLPNDRLDRLDTLVGLYSLVYSLILVVMFIRGNEDIISSTDIEDKKNITIMSIINILFSLVIIILFLAITIYLICVLVSNITDNFTYNLIYDYFLISFGLLVPAALLFFKRTKKYFIFAYLPTLYILHYLYIQLPNINYENIFKEKGIICESLGKPYHNFGEPYIKKGDEIFTPDGLKGIATNNIFYFCEDINIKRFYFIDDNKIYKRDNHLNIIIGE